MPKRSRSSRGRRSYRSKRRRTYKKWKKLGTPSRTIVKSTRGSPFSDAYYCRMRYCYGYNMASVGGSMSDVILNINSLYDPEYAVGGHQPFGRDQLAGVYNKYRVFGVKYKFTFWNTDSSTPALVAVVPSNQSGSDTIFNTVAERPYAKHVILPPGGAIGVKTIKGYASMAKVHGVKKSVVKNDDTFAAFANADPARMAYLHCYGVAIDGSTSITLRIRVELTYMACWFDRIPIDGS